MDFEGRQYAGAVLTNSGHRVSSVFATEVPKILSRAVFTTQSHPSTLSATPSTLRNTRW